MAHKVYQKLEIDYELPEILEKTINEYVEYLNSDEDENRLSDDLYQSEIRAILNGCDGDLDESQYWQLRRYYVSGGIYG